MPIGPFPDLDACMAHMRERYSEEIAKKVCGKMKAKLEKKDAVNANDLVNADCVHAHMNYLSDLHPNKDVKTRLYDAYDYCRAKADFEALTIRSYDFIRKISARLAETGQDFYSINDAAVMSQIGFGGSEFRIEPMKTLAEAATAGKRTSENIEKVGYFNSMLEVEFQDGRRYIYFVGPDFYDRFVAADSKGKFLWDELRGKDPGLVWPGTDPNRRTPGGVGGSKVPYARGTAGTPEAGEPKLPEGKERELYRKEIEIAFRREGLKFKKLDEGLERGKAYTELKHAFKKLPQQKRDFTLDLIKERIDNFKELNRSYKAVIARDVIVCMNDLLSDLQGAESDEFLEFPVKDYVSQIEENGKLTAEQKENLIAEIKLFDKELKKLGDTISVRETKNYVRKRQFDPSDCQEGTFRTFTVGKGKKAIGCKRKSTGKFAVQSILEPKSDTITDDSLQEFYAWIRKHTDAKNEEEVKVIAFMINNARKNKKKKREKEASKREYDEEIKKKKETAEERKSRKKKEWTKGWSEIGEEFTKLRKNRQRYKEYMKGMNIQHQRSLYGTWDMGVPIMEDDCGSILDFGVCEKRFNLLYDFYHAENEEVKNDLQAKIDKNNVDVMEDTLIEGVLTQAGPFKYGDNILYKKWNNIVENAEQTTVLPIFGSRLYGSHEEREERLIGYIDVFNPDHEKKKLRFRGHTFEPIEKLSDLRDPSKLNLSLSFYDDRAPDSNVQVIKGFRHAAISLNNLEQDRCSSIDGMGHCYASPVSEGAQKATLPHLTKKRGARDTVDHRTTMEVLPGSDGARTERATSDGQVQDFSSASDLSLITQKEKRGSEMPDDNITDEKIDEIIADFIAEDALRETGNEVQGHTNRDGFMNQCQKHGNSPAACEKAWVKFNENKATSPEKSSSVSKETGGHVKQKGDFVQLSKEEYDSLTKTIQDFQETIKPINKYLKDMKEKEETQIKQKLKIPFGEDGQKKIDSLSYDMAKQLEPIFEDLLKEHPELLGNVNANDMSEQNLSKVLETIGKTEYDLRKKKDFLESMKENAEKKRKALWAKKGGATS